MGHLNSTHLSASLQERRGYSNFVRLIAAVGVLLSHSYPLSGSGSDPLIGDSPLGEISVSIFFALSGYFVFRSALNWNLRDFAILRMARLFPALIAANFFLAFAIGPAISSITHESNYWQSSNGPFQYFFFNSTLGFGLQSSLAEMFSKVPYPNVVNGSLWTLPTELKCYFLSALTAILIKRTQRQFPLYVVFIFVSSVYLLGLAGNSLIDENIPTSTSRLVLVFISGALLAKVNLVQTRSTHFVLLLVLLGFLVVLWNSNEIASFLYWVIIPVIAMTPIRIAKCFDFFNKRDFSYGFYLWAFPIQQLIMYLGVVEGAISLAILTFLITLIFSGASWYLVESPALSGGRTLVRDLDRNSR